MQHHALLVGHAGQRLVRARASAAHRPAGCASRTACRRSRCRADCRPCCGRRRTPPRTSARTLSPPRRTRPSRRRRPASARRPRRRGRSARLSSFSARLQHPFGSALRDDEHHPEPGRQLPQVQALRRRAVRPRTPARLCGSSSSARTARVEQLQSAGMHRECPGDVRRIGAFLEQPGPFTPPRRVHTPASGRSGLAPTTTTHRVAPRAGW